MFPPFYSSKSVRFFRLSFQVYSSGDREHGLLNSFPYSWIHLFETEKEYKRNIIKAGKIGLQCVLVTAYFCVGHLVQ